MGLPIPQTIRLQVAGGGTDRGLFCPFHARSLSKVALICGTGGGRSLGRGADASDPTEAHWITSKFTAPANSCQIASLPTAQGGRKQWNKFRRVAKLVSWPVRCCCQIHGFIHPPATKSGNLQCPVALEDTRTTTLCQEQVNYKPIQHVTEHWCYGSRISLRVI